jgi:hypothetical protein
MFYKSHKKKLLQTIKNIKSNPRNNIDNRTINEIENEIKYFSELDAQQLELKKLEDECSSLITGHSRTPYRIKFEGVFRARINDIEEFNLVSQLWYPNWESIDKKHHRYGRCNDIAESIFYCSTESDTAILETKPKLHDIITLVEYSNRNPFCETIIQPIGISELQILENGYKELFKNHYKKTDSEERYLKNLKLDTFLSSLFKEEIKTEENWKYKFSIAVSKILLNGQHEGIIYPSVSAKMKGANYALKTHVPDSNFQIINGRMFRVTKTVENSFYEMEVIKILHNVSGDFKNYKAAKINWRDIKDTDKDLILRIDY